MARKKQDERLVKFFPSNHAYYVEGKRFGSVTTCAKKMQNGFALEQYAKRQVAIGLGQRPDLVQLIVANHGDESFEARQALDDVVEQAYEAAKAGAKANTGTAIHKVLERIDKGEKFTPADRAMAQVAADYRAALAEAELVAQPHLVERIVVLRDHGLAGMIDRGYLDRLAAVILGDVKSGLNAIAYPHSMAAQLGIYSLAPAMYDAETDELVDPPKWGELVVIAHTPITGGVELWTMPLDVCREVAEHALWLHGWVKRDAGDIVKQWIVPAANPEPFQGDAPPASATASVEASTSAPSDRGEGGVPPAQPADPFDGLVDGYVADPASAERRAWVIKRVVMLSTLGGLEQVAALWPSGVAALKLSDRHTDRDLDQICVVLNEVEAAVNAPFPTPDPATLAVAPRESRGRTFWTPPDEGPAISDEEYGALADWLGRLTPAQRDVVIGWAAEANKAGRGYSLVELRSVRRFEIIRAAFTLAEACASPTGVDVEVVRALVIAAGITSAAALGITLGSLTRAEASELGALAASFAEGAIPLAFTEEGLPIIVLATAGAA